MSAKGRGSRSGRRLPDEDEGLWHEVTRNVAPLRLKPRVAGAAKKQIEEQRLRSKAAVVDHGREPQAKLQPVAPEPRASKPPPLADFDARTARKIAAGRVDIEARLDLHGLRQSEAHASLRAFLHSSQARGLRVVLVITGKGAPSDAGRPSGDEAGSSLDPRDRGVLRRNVPRWLAEPELRRVVVSHTTAHIRHGGQGAMYVTLRKRGVAD